MSNKFASILLICAAVSCSRQEAPARPPSNSPAQTTVATESRTPAEVVEAFGEAMKRVSTTASPEVAAGSIRTNYAGLVHPRLLDEWAASPSAAPGRPVSSPWPDRIEVQSSSRSEGVVTVEGTLVERTSTGEAGRVPVRLQLEQSGASWLITSYQSLAIEPGEEGAEAAVAVVREYYRAIDAGDYQRAFSYWGDFGPPGQTFESFAKGFANTASVRVTTGAASRVEPAAGSRYVDVPVTIAATTKAGDAEEFAGTYTLRRAMVDGASPSERKWHLYRASIHRVD